MEQLDVLSNFLEEHVDEERVRYALMSTKMDEMAEQIKTLSTQVEMLVNSWNQARGVLSFVKWFVGISGSITAFLLFIKEHVK